MLRALAHEAAEGREVAPPVAVVSGPPGSGKTSLAVRLAEEPGSPGPDGAFLMDMRGWTSGRCRRSRPWRGCWARRASRTPTWPG
ncbi:hypothetical protein AB0929_18760 [Streptomyces massasporeus]|uniref:hypothetical protein n=1 Tax=Streptomyces massasporeus TaxID=67324 RepID=UPI00345704C0